MRKLTPLVGFLFFSCATVPLPSKDADGVDYCLQLAAHSDTTGNDFMLGAATTGTIAFGLTLVGALIQPNKQSSDLIEQNSNLLLLGAGGALTAVTALLVPQVMEHKKTSGLAAEAALEKDSALATCTRLRTSVLNAQAQSAGQVPDVIKAQLANQAAQVEKQKAALASLENASKKLNDRLDAVAEEKAEVEQRVLSLQQEIAEGKKTKVQLEFFETSLARALEDKEGVRRAYEELLKSVRQVELQRAEAANKSMLSPKEIPPTAIPAPPPSGESDTRKQDGEK